MKDGYYGHTKYNYYPSYKEYLHTDPYYFKVKNNKIVDCVVGWDDLAYSDEAKEESTRLKKEFIGKDASLIEQNLGKEYITPCPEEIFTKAKEIEMQRFDLPSEEEYQKFVNKTVEKTDIANQTVTEIQKNTDVKIEFFELDKTKSDYTEERTDEPNHGTFGEWLGSFTNKQEVVNAKVDDTPVNILRTTNGSLIVDGSSENQNLIEQKYDFTIGNNKYTASINMGGFGDPEPLYYSRCQILEAKDLEELLNKPDLSREDLMILETNLETRQTMPESIRNFTSFKDLQTRIYQNPEKIKENVQAMFKLMRIANIDKNNTKPFESLMLVMNNLRNTDNHEFNMQFKDAVKDVVMTYQRKNVNTGHKYWCIDSEKTKEVLDKIEPLSKMQYSLPKYLKRVRKKIQGKFNHKKAENISKNQKSSTHPTKSIDNGR